MKNLRNKYWNGKGNGLMDYEEHSCDNCKWRDECDDVGEGEG